MFPEKRVFRLIVVLAGRASVGSELSGCGGKAVPSHDGDDVAGVGWAAGRCLDDGGELPEVAGRH